MHQPLHIKNFHKSVDEGLGSMVAINNHSEGASQHAANKQVHSSILKLVLVVILSSIKVLREKTLWLWWIFNKPQKFFLLSVKCDSCSYSY